MALLPVEPLASVVHRRGVVNTQLNGQRSPERRAFYRAVRSGHITDAQAEKIAAILRLHPVEIWGLQWWEAVS